MPTAVVWLRPAATRLDVSVLIRDGGDLAVIVEVVEVHLKRFAFREPEIVFDWSPAQAVASR